MSGIVFQSVKYKNFLSTGNAWTEIRLDQKNTTLIVGANGSGKSTILDALSFALYNKPFRNINKPQLVNSINNRDCEVEVLFHTAGAQYRVCRGIRPNFFEVYRNDELVGQSAAVKDYQDILENQILKMNYHSFCQIVVLGSSTYVPFMQLFPVHRRKVIEDLLDIQIFSTMNVLLKKRVDNNKNSLDQVKYLIDLTNEKIAMQKKYIATLKEDKQSQIDEANGKIAGLLKEIADMEEAKKSYLEAAESILATTPDLNKLTEKVALYNQTRDRANYKITQTKKELTFYESNSNCPTCKQGIEAQFKHQCINNKQEELLDLETNLNLLVVEYDKMVEALNEAKNKQNAIAIQQRNAANMAVKIETTYEYIALLEASIIKIQEESGTVEAEQDKLAVLVQELHEHEALRETLTFDSSILAAGAAMLKDSGIKSRIIKQYIPIINKLINKYLASLEFFVQFELDEQFNEKLKSRFRDEFTYASFSEGEKMRINLAILFTWRAISKMRNSASTNLLIMDEVFDGSLDAAGTEEFLKILNNLTHDTNTFIISHKTDQLFDKFDAVIKFEKQGNYSRIA